MAPGKAGEEGAGRVPSRAAIRVSCSPAGRGWRVPALQRVRAATRRPTGRRWAGGPRALAHEPRALGKMRAQRAMAGCSHGRRMCEVHSAQHDPRGRLSRLPVPPARLTRARRRGRVLGVVARRGAATGSTPRHPLSRPTGPSSPGSPPISLVCRPSRTPNHGGADPDRTQPVQPCSGRRPVTRTRAGGRT